MIDTINKLRRQRNGTCISSPAEQEAADIIEGLRAELEWVAEYRRQALSLRKEIDAMKQQQIPSAEPEAKP